MNGPVARAGSILYLLRDKGTNVPKSDANIITENNDIDTVILTSNR